MSESVLQVLVFFKLIWISCFSLLYGLGGIDGKWKRRYAAPCWMGLGLFGFSMWRIGSFNPWILLYMPLLGISLSTGYGADTTKEKIIKRLRYGALLGLAALPIAIVTGHWLLFGFHAFLCISTSVLLGVFNPIDARHEETLIATLSGIIPLFMI